MYGVMINVKKKNNKKTKKTIVKPQEQNEFPKTCNIHYNVQIKITNGNQLQQYYSFSHLAKEANMSN